MFYLKVIIIWIEFNFHEIFSYSPALPLYIVLIRYLILPQSFLYFVNTSLFVEAKIKYLFPLVSSMFPSALLIMSYKGFTLWIFS